MFTDGDYQSKLPLFTGYINDVTNRLIGVVVSFRTCAQGNMKAALIKGRGALVSTPDGRPNQDEESAEASAACGAGGRAGQVGVGGRSVPRRHLR